LQFSQKNLTNYRIHIVPHVLGFVKWLLKYYKTPTDGGGGFPSREPPVRPLLRCYPLASVHLKYSKIHYKTSVFRRTGFRPPASVPSVQILTDAPRVRPNTKKPLVL